MQILAGKMAEKIITPAIHENICIAMFNNGAEQVAAALGSADEYSELLDRFAARPNC
jgi:hypothetical protein